MVSLLLKKKLVVLMLLVITLLSCSPLFNSDNENAFINLEVQRNAAASFTQANDDAYSWLVLNMTNMMERHSKDL